MKCPRLFQHEAVYLGWFPWHISRREEKTLFVRVLSIPFISDLGSLELVEEIASDQLLRNFSWQWVLVLVLRNIGYSWWLKTGPLSLSHIA